MNDQWLTLIIILLLFLFCIIGFWFIVFIYLIKSLVTYKTTHLFGRLSTANFKRSYVEIILINNNTLKVYVNNIKDLSIQDGFMYIHAKYSLRRLNFVADTVLSIPTIIDEQKFNGLFGCKAEIKE